MGFYNDNIKKFTKLRQDKKWTDYRQLAEKGWNTGDYDCLLLLGVDYYRGLSTTTDYARAFQIFDEVVKKTPENCRGEIYGDANMYLGMCYYFAEGVKRDVQKAIDYLNVALKYNPSIIATYTTIGVNARTFYEQGNTEKMQTYMNVLYDLATKDGDLLAMYSYAAYLIQGEPFARKMYDGTNAKGADVARGIEMMKNCAEKCEYAQYYMSLMYCFGCAPYLKEDAKKATKYLDMAAQMEFWPATIIKSKAFENVRDDKVVYEKTTTTYYSDGTYSTVTETIVKDKYGRWHDAMDKLNLIIANSHVHDMDRDLMQLHDYAPFHVDNNAKMIRKYPKDANAIVLKKGPVAHKAGEVADVIEGKYPLAQPVYEINYADYPVSYLSQKPVPQPQTAPSEQKPADESSVAAAFGEVADKVKDAAKVGLDKVKGLFNKFKK